MFDYTLFLLRLFYSIIHYLALRNLSYLFNFDLPSVIK